MRFEERQIPAGGGNPAVAVLLPGPKARAGGLPILEFEASLLRLIDGGVRHIVVDLATIERIDSRTIQSLLHATQYCRRKHARLVLCRPSGLLRKTIRNLGLDPALPCFESEEAAVGHLQRVGRGSGYEIAFHAAGDPDCVATALALAPTLDGIVLRYPWKKRRDALDPRRLLVGGRLRLRPSWDPGREITAEIERVEPAADGEQSARDYHLAFRDVGPEEAPAPPA